MAADPTDDLRSDEGWEPFVYDDKTGAPIVKGSVVQGYPTIGYGFCVSKDRGAPLPKHIADAWLEWSVQQRWQSLVSQIPWVVNQPDDVKRALSNMAYQLGVHGVLGFPNMLRALREGKRAEAADHALDSEWARTQTPARALRVAELIRGSE